MLPRKVFEYLHAVMATLVLFEQFSGTFYLHILPLILNDSPSVMHFVRTFSIMRAWLIVIEEVQNYIKIIFINNIFENGWWGMHLLHPLLAYISVHITQYNTQSIG